MFNSWKSQNKLLRSNFPKPAQFYNQKVFAAVKYKLGLLYITYMINLNDKLTDPAVLLGMDTTESLLQDMDKNTSELFIIRTKNFKENIHQ